MMRRGDRGLKVDTSPGKESTGSEYFLDSVKSASEYSFSMAGRWSGRRRLLRKGGAATPEKIDLGHFEEPLRRLSFTEKDLMEVIGDRDEFRSLQNELRRKGAITNSMVKEGIHHYVQNCLEKKQSDSPTSVMTTPKSPFATRQRLRLLHTPPRW